MARDAAAIHIPGTNQIYIIRLPQTASEDAVSEHDTLILALDAEIRRLQVLLRDVRQMTAPGKVMGLTAESTRCDAAYIEGFNAALARVRATLGERE